MKNAALLSGALVTPSSSTLGILDGRGVGSLYGCSAIEPSRYELIVDDGDDQIDAVVGFAEFD